VATFAFQKKMLFIYDYRNQIKGLCIMTFSRAKISPNPQVDGLEIGRSPRNKGSVKTLPNPNAYPVPQWLRFLMSAQRLSITVTVLLTVAVFGVYSWTVYAQEAWNKQYRRLEELKRHERNLTATEGLLENSLIRDAQRNPDRRLVRETPEQSIFLQSAPRRSLTPPNEPTKQEPDLPFEPLGY
jgi:hypothetical protein